MAGGSFCLLLAFLLGLSGIAAKREPSNSNVNDVTGSYNANLQEKCPTAGDVLEPPCCSCQEVRDCFMQVNANSSLITCKMPDGQETIYLCRTMQDSLNRTPGTVVSQCEDSEGCPFLKHLQCTKCTSSIEVEKLCSSTAAVAAASTFSTTSIPATETYSTTIPSTPNPKPTTTHRNDESTVAQETSTKEMKKVFSSAAAVAAASTFSTTSNPATETYSTTISSTPNPKPTTHRSDESTVAQETSTKEPGIITVNTILLFIIVFVLVIILGIIIIIKKRRKSVFRICGNEESSMESGNGTSSTHRPVAPGKRSSPDGAFETETTTYADVELTSKQPPIDNAGYAFVTSSPDDVIAVRNNAIYEDIDAVSNQSPTNCNTNTAIISPVYAMPPDAVNAAENPSGAVYAEPYQTLSSAAVSDFKAGTNKKTLSPGADQNINVIYSQPIKSKNTPPSNPNAIYSQPIKWKK